MRLQVSIRLLVGLASFVGSLVTTSVLAQPSGAAPPVLFHLEDPSRIVQLRLVTALGHRVTDHATKVQVDHEDSIAAGTRNLEFARKLRHEVILRNAHSELQC